MNRKDPFHKEPTRAAILFELVAGFWWVPVMALVGIVLLVKAVV